MSIRRASRSWASSDLAYSLDEIDQSMKTHGVHLIGLLIAFVLLFSVSIGFLLRRLVFVPLKDLEGGAKQSHVRRS